MSPRSQGAGRLNARSDASALRRKKQQRDAASGAQLGAVLDGILRVAMLHLLEHQPATEHGWDPEGFHQYRIALRRLRSVLGLLRRLAPSPQLDRFRHDAHWLMEEINDARDWDVFVIQTLPPIARACPKLSGFDTLGEVAAIARAKAHAKARAAITDPRTRLFQNALGLWLDQQGWCDPKADARGDLLSGPARAAAARMLHKLHRKALKRGRGFKALDTKARHEVRIAIKKLRYAADSILPMLGNANRHRRYIRTLSELQDRLGHSNDMAVTERLLRPLLQNAMPLAAHQAVGAVLGWQASRAQSEDGALRSAWKRFVNS